MSLTAGLKKTGAGYFFCHEYLCYHWVELYAIPSLPAIIAAPPLFMYSAQRKCVHPL